MKNTKIYYLYRDASNYKKGNVAIVEGAITEEQIDTIMECLDCGEYFIPRQVGLPEVQFGKITEDDHCWFELCRENFDPTDEEADTGMDVEELVKKFLAASGNWDDSELLADDYEEDEEEEE